MPAGFAIASLVHGPTCSAEVLWWPGTGWTFIGKELHFLHPTFPCRLCRWNNEEIPLLIPCLQAFTHKMQPSHQPQSLPPSQCQTVLPSPTRSCLLLPFPALSKHYFLLCHPGQQAAPSCFSAYTPAGGHDTLLVVIFLLLLLIRPAVVASGPWLFIFFTFSCTCFLFLPAVSIPHFAIPTVVLDSCRTSVAEDKTPMAEGYFMMYIYFHKIFCMAVTSRFSQTVCALRLFLTPAANSSLTGFIILHYSQQARSLCHMLSSPSKANHVPMLAANQDWLKPVCFLHAICFERIGDRLHISVCLIAPLCSPLTA